MSIHTIVILITQDHNLLQSSVLLQSVLTVIIPTHLTTFKGVFSFSMRHEKSKITGGNGRMAAAKLLLTPN